MGCELDFPTCEGDVHKGKGNFHFLAPDFPAVPRVFLTPLTFPQGLRYLVKTGFSQHLLKIAHIEYVPVSQAVRQPWVDVRLES